MASNPVRDLDDASLIARLEEGREELFNLRFQLATGQLTATSRMRIVKKDIARCLTEVRAREIAAAEAVAAEGTA